MQTSKKSYKQAFYLIVSIVLTFGLSISLQSLLAAWTAPGVSPPGGNVSPPVYNEHTNPQTNALINMPLGVGGNLTLTGNGNIALGDNWLTGDGTDGEGIYIDSNGNVGIGTNTPGVKLAIEGNIVASAPTGNNQVATKGYVDAAGTAGGATLIFFTGDRYIGWDLNSPAEADAKCSDIIPGAVMAKADTSIADGDFIFIGSYPPEVSGGIYDNESYAWMDDTFRPDCANDAGVDWAGPGADVVATNVATVYDYNNKSFGFQGTNQPDRDFDPLYKTDICSTPALPILCIKY